MRKKAPLVAYKKLLLGSASVDKLVNRILSILGLDLRIINESYYYLRYLLISITYIVVFSIMIIFINWKIGGLIVFALILLTFVLGRLGSSNAHSGAEMSKKGSDTSRFLSWLISNYKYIALLVILPE